MRVDAAAYAGCASPLTLGPLAEGPHSLAVRALDPGAGTQDDTPAEADFTIDTTPPDTPIRQGPRLNLAGPSTATFSMRADDTSRVSFQCSLDFRPFHPCHSPLTTGPLANTWHTFRVRGKDAAGNVDPTPASRSFLVGPTLRIRVTHISVPATAHGLIRRGVGARARCNVECRITVIARLAKSSRRRLGLDESIIARRSVTQRRGGTIHVQATLDPAAVQAIRSHRFPPLALRTLIHGSRPAARSGKSTVVARSVDTLSR